METHFSQLLRTLCCLSWESAALQAPAFETCVFLSHSLLALMDFHTALCTSARNKKLGTQTHTSKKGARLSSLLPGIWAVTTQGSRDLQGQGEPMELAHKHLQCYISVSCPARCTALRHRRSKLAQQFQCTASLIENLFSSRVKTSGKQKRWKLYKVLLCKKEKSIFVSVVLNGRTWKSFSAMAEWVFPIPHK